MNDLLRNIQVLKLLLSSPLSPHPLSQSPYPLPQYPYPVPQSSHPIP